MLTGNIRGHLSECPIYAWVELEDATLITSSRHPNHFRSCSICAGWVYCTSIVRCECVATANGYQCTSTQGPVIHIQYYPEYVSTIAGPESKINELFVGIYIVYDVYVWIIGGRQLPSNEEVSCRTVCRMCFHSCRKKRTKKLPVVHATVGCISLVTSLYGTVRSRSSFFLYCMLVLDECTWYGSRVSLSSRQCTYLSY